MAVYIDEEEVWKCPKHPSKRRRNGICPTCLRERLITLCPDCANVRPCACNPPTTAATSSSSSSSSSFSLFASRRHTTAAGENGSVGKVSNLIDSEPSFRRSRSVAIPFLRSRSRFGGDPVTADMENSGGGENKASSFWGVFKKINKSKKIREDAERENDGEIMMMMRKSRSVAVTSDFVVGDVRSRIKGKGWYFPSPMKVFRQASKVVHERSPLHRG